MGEKFFAARRIIAADTNGRTEQPRVNPDKIAALFSCAERKDAKQQIFLDVIFYLLLQKTTATQHNIAATRYGINFARTEQ